ncbi:ComEC/Rec2 family competence protein [Paenibacillus lautus]|uniref:ComEC/Rec2 family competence protein n=1 Tax=Paenibacillus lautus TaxID=1401 RepID=UPI002DB6CB84|nr:ComEC/Rec2 family competence protein [Paenibacillus lautus]MEC0202533.1 ComEC/Rec2 family competence protein [Paenibacillus lautus]
MKGFVQIMKRRPLLVFTVLWVIGSGAACLYDGWRLALIAAGLILILLAVCHWAGAGRLFSLCMLFSLCVSGTYWEWHDAANVSDFEQVLSGKTSTDTVPVNAFGVITSPIEADGDRADFNVSLHQAALTLAEPPAPQKQANPDNGTMLKTDDIVRVQVKLLDKKELEIVNRWQRGDRIELTGELQKPGEARNFDGFDYLQYLRTQKIHWMIKVKGSEQAQVTPPGSWNLGHILRWTDAVREKLGGKLDQLYDGIHAGYMKGLVIGNQDDLDPDTFMEFSRLGLTHILAISGMHVAVVVGCLLFVCTTLRMTRETSLTVVMWLIPVYVLLTGASPSIVRAGIMGMIGLYAARRRLLKDGLHILSVAALAMLLWNPYFLVNVSFQLSFIVTAGLMIFVPKLMPLLTFLPRWLAGTVGITVVAQLISFPLTIYYFNQVSLISVFANLILVPVISLVVLPLGMVSLLMGWVWMRGAGWLAAVTEWLNQITFRIVEWMNGSSAFMTLWPSPSLAWILCYFVVLYSLLSILKKSSDNRQEERSGADDTVPLAGHVPFDSKRSLSGATGMFPLVDQWAGAFRWRGFLRASDYIERYAARTAIVLLSGALVFLLYGGYQSPSLHGAGLVQFLDVGQGDAILVTTPEGKHVLIDGGGTVNFRKEKDAWKERKAPYEVGAKVVVPLLKKRGVHQLEAVIMTHGDQDHIGGLQAVLQEIPVKSVVFNGTLTESATFGKLMLTAVQQGIPIYEAGVDREVWKLDSHTEIQFLAPVFAESGETIKPLPLVKEQNHASLVFVLQMNGSRFLFTGDTDQAAEHKILLHLEERSPQDDLVSGGAVVDDRIDVMKVAHHGSKTSTSALWLNAWKPKASVISAGVNNMYGHPHPDVVGRLERSSTLIYQTNLQGEIQMRIKEGHIETRTKLP